jgi:hypothetical protein
MPPRALAILGEKYEDQRDLGTLALPAAAIVRLGTIVPLIRGSSTTI